MIGPEEAKEWKTFYPCLIRNVLLFKINSKNGYL